MQVCDALAYYYLRNPLPFEMPIPKPLIPPPVEGGKILASDINYFRFAARPRKASIRKNQMDPVDYGVPPALFR